ncbi:hypothetical protein BTVI_19955 [Pitangus sulphuratus]|nr:hypothetical protein BTVI_19955 [Pitangus sulphuratus]
MLGSGRLHVARIKIRLAKADPRVVLRVSLLAFIQTKLQGFLMFSRLDTSEPPGFLWTPGQERKQWSDDGEFLQGDAEGNLGHRPPDEVRIVSVQYQIYPGVSVDVQHWYTFSQPKYSAMCQVLNVRVHLDAQPDFQSQAEARTEEDSVNWS